MNQTPSPVVRLGKGYAEDSKQRSPKAVVSISKHHCNDDYVITAMKSSLATPLATESIEIESFY